MTPQVGSKVAVDRAYGHMIRKSRSKAAIWIGSGIGMTPFIYIREHPILDKNVCFTIVSERKNAVYLGSTSRLRSSKC